MTSVKSIDSRSHPPLAPCAICSGPIRWKSLARRAAALSASAIIRCGVAAISIGECHAKPTLRSFLFLSVFTPSATFSKTTIYCQWFARTRHRTRDTKCTGGIRLPAFPGSNSSFLFRRLNFNYLVWSQFSRLRTISMYITTKRRY